MHIKQISIYVMAYLLWIAAMLLGVAFLLIGMNGIPQLLAPFFSATEFNERFMAGFINRIFLVVSGIGILVIIVAVESFFRHGAQSNTLWQRAARVFGPMLLLVFVADLCQAVYFQNSFGLTPPLLRLTLELAAALALAFLGYRKPLPRLPRRPNANTF